MIQCGPVEAVRLSRLQRTHASLLKAREMCVSVASSGLLLVHLPWAHRPPVELRTCVRTPVLVYGTACALFVIQCGPVVGIPLSCLQRTLTSLLKAREMDMH